MVETEGEQMQNTGFCRPWVVQEKVIKDYAERFGSQAMLVGGRFIATNEVEEEQMWGSLRELGFLLDDSDQLEVLAAKRIVPSCENVRALIYEFQEVAKKTGLRLQAVEGKSSENELSFVLASEADYIPWWTS